MTIAAYLEKHTLEWAQKRLRKLREIGAPTIIVEHAVRCVAHPMGHVAKKGLREFGSVEFLEVSKHTGRGGNAYLRFTDPGRLGEDILYVPSNWGGKYLYRQKVRQENDPPL